MIGLLCTPRLLFTLKNSDISQFATDFHFLVENVELFASCLVCISGHSFLLCWDDMLSASTPWS